MYVRIEVKRETKSLSQCSTDIQLYAVGSDHPQHGSIYTQLFHSLEEDLQQDQEKSLRY